MTRLILLCLSFCILSAPSLAQAVPEARHVLKGRIIRALAIEPGNPNHILVGQKGRKPGSGLVFKSLDGGKSWRTQNANAALAPKATDVQAVAAVSKSTLMAGTWKHGLFISRNGGKSFQAAPTFPSTDVRDFAISATGIYAASGLKGVFESADGGKSWTSVGLPKHFLWSVTAMGNTVYASSPDAGVFERKNIAWSPLFDQDKVYATALSPGAEQQIALAGETGLYLRKGKGWQKTLAGEKFADVLFADENHVLAGSWANGLVVVSPEGKLLRRLLAGKTVIHLQIAGERLFAGTWGDGLHILPLKAVLP